MESRFRTYDFAVRFARECRKLRVPYDLQEQLNRASASVALNLKEGSARHTKKGRHRFYRTAFGSYAKQPSRSEITEGESLQSLSLIPMALAPVPKPLTLPSCPLSKTILMGHRPARSSPRSGPRADPIDAPAEACGL